LADFNLSYTGQEVQDQLDKVTQNESDISTNTSDISTNTSDILSLDSRVDNLETIPISIISGSTTASSSHVNRIVLCNNSSAMNFTVNASLPIGSEIVLVQYNTGSVTIVESGVIIHSIDSKKTISDLYGAVTLKKIDISTWLLIGALV